MKGSCNVLGIDGRYTQNSDSYSHTAFDGIDYAEAVVMLCLLNKQTNKQKKKKQTKKQK